MTPPRSCKPSLNQLRDPSYPNSSDSETASKVEDTESDGNYDNEGKSSDSEIQDLSNEMENTSVDDRQSPRNRKGFKAAACNRGKELYPNLDEFRKPYGHSPKSDAGSPRHGPSLRPSYRRSTSKISLSFINIAIIFIIISAIIVVSYLLLFNTSTVTTTVAEDSSGVIYVEDIENDMMSIFKNQSQTTWGIIRSQLGSQLPRRRSPLKAQRDPVRPSTLLMVGFNDGATLRCFTRKLSGFVAQAYKRKVCIRADAEENNDSGDVAKWHMDLVVNNGYNQGDRCFHIKRLGHLSAEELLMLHAWCDGDHSPYKDSVFIFSFIIEKTKTMDERAVYSHLQDKWTSLLGPNEAPALLSRVANNIVIINEEKRTEDFMSSCLR